MDIRTVVLVGAAVLAAGCGGGGGGSAGAGGSAGSGSGGRTGSGLPRELTFPLGVRGTSPRFSPDGARLAYTRDEGDVTAVAVMSLPSADSRTIATDGDYLTAMTWSSDGTEVIYAAEDDIRAVPVAGGAARQVVNAFAAVGPDLSPDGKALAYGINGSNLRLADLSQTPPVITDLGTVGSAPRFSPDGRTIAYWSGDTLQIMELATHAATDVITGDSNIGFGGVDWFKDGRRLLAGTDRGVEIVTLGPPVTRQLVRSTFALLDVDLSPDETQVAYAVNGQTSLFILSGI